MQITEIRFNYRFHAAGQGTFASGTLTCESSTEKFHWVFDCGSLTLKTILSPLIKRYREMIVGNYLDLLCISHFDYDHVNGLADLLKGLHVDTVVIPYYSRLERLVLGASLDPPSASYISFLSNPIAFLLENAASISQIVILGYKPDDDDILSKERPPRKPLQGIDSEFPRSEKNWRVKLPQDSPSEQASYPNKATRALAEKRNTSLFFLTQTTATAFVVPPISHYQQRYGWEFLFFHKPIEQSIRRELLLKIRRTLAIHCRSKNITSLTEALRDESVRKHIKTIYQQTLKGKENINSTSLCVYSGPLLDEFHCSFVCSPMPDPLMVQPFHYSLSRDHMKKCSLLYTGDANLQPAENRKELRDFINIDRWDLIYVLQVPHHGSKANWQPGAALEFSHSYSVFCADELHQKYQHPSREVVLDLLHRGPLLANKVYSWSFSGMACFTKQ
jgi:hypothetical protein